MTPQQQTAARQFGPLVSVRFIKRRHLGSFTVGLVPKQQGVDVAGLVDQWVNGLAGPRNTSSADAALSSQAQTERPP